MSEFGCTNEGTYVDTILTFAFNINGRVVVKRNKAGKLDTLPWLFMGHREKESKMDYEDDIWIMNNREEYEERIATFFAYHLRNGRSAILNGYFYGNKNNLISVGTGFSQVEEMTKIQTPSYINVNQEFYDLGTRVAGQNIFHRIETRYIVLPNDDIKDFPELELVELQALKQNFKDLSTKIILGITGEDGEMMASFVSQLEYLNKTTSRKKHFE